jgi:hypothetical protein
MKAEHRKELETNVLADRVGRVVQNMKQAPQKRTMLFLVVIGIVVVLVVLWTRRGQVQRMENSERWIEFAEGSAAAKRKLESDPDSNQVKAILFEESYSQLRRALRFLAAQPTQVLDVLERLDLQYERMAEQCKNDKVLLPEALYARAVIAETRIMKDDENWKAALDAYNVVANNHKDTAFGKLAAKRAEILNNQEKRNKILELYRDLRLTFVTEDRFPGILPPKLVPPIPVIPK